MCGDTDRDSIGVRLRSPVGYDEATARAPRRHKANQPSLISVNTVNECRQPFAPSSGSQRCGSMKTSTTHFLRETFQGVVMSSAKQRTAAKHNVKKAVAAKAKKT